MMEKRKLEEESVNGPGNQPSPQQRRSGQPKTVHVIVIVVVMVTLGRWKEGSTNRLALSWPTKLVM